MRRNDFILIAIILLLCIGVFAYIHFTKQAGSKVVVTVDGKVYDTFDLSKDITYTVKGKNGAFNTFQIKNGYADMIDASCPDLLCVHEKSIHYNHETIVCLPNKVVLEVISKDSSEVDMIAN